ncbi:MAG: hypothetical protein HY907_14625 [Deltaproteobacteria bacterium]|nr:hypothetical protein [Deltaproteobacteria bacterium]
MIGGRSAWARGIRRATVRLGRLLRRHALQLAALWLVTGGCEGGCFGGGDFDCCDECSPSLAGGRYCRNGGMYACSDEGTFCGAGVFGWVSVDHTEGCHSSDYDDSLEWECFEPEPGEAACRERGAAPCAAEGASGCAGEWIRACRNGYWARTTHCRSVTSRSGDVVFVDECALDEAGEPYCREVGGGPCVEPGTTVCDGDWVVECTARGFLEHTIECDAAEGYPCNAANGRCDWSRGTDADADADVRDVMDSGRDDADAGTEAEADSLDVPPDPVCGNGVVERWEDCDGAPASCRAFDCVGLADCLPDCRASTDCVFGPAPPGDVCGSSAEPTLDDVLDAQVVEGSICGATDDAYESPACPVSPGPDAGFLLDLAEPRHAWVVLRAPYFRGVLRVRDGAACPGDEWACAVASSAAGGASTGLGVVLPAGRHRIVVDSHDSVGKGLYTLTVTLSEPPP